LWAARRRHRLAKLLNSGGILATDAMERLRSEMLTLSEAERAELAHALIESLSTPPEEGAEEAWDQEPLGRISQVDAGQATLIDREALRQRMRARLRAR
jgi:putative addiction module component (TIGR02574 family)